MDSRLYGHFEHFISERIQEIHRLDIAKSVEFIEIRAQIKRLGEEILLYLPEQYQDLLALYEELENISRALVQEAYFKHGIEDGIRFAKAFGKV